MKLIPLLLLAAAFAPSALRAQDAEPAPDLADTLRAEEIAHVDRPPSIPDRATAARLVQAAYPASLRDSGVGGTAVVRLVVDARGRPLAPRLARTSGNAPLDSAALKAVEGMRFEPASRAGAARPVWVTLPISFEALPAEGALSDSVYEIAEVDELPELLNRSDVARAVVRAYPPELRRNGVTGFVWVMVVIDSRGIPGQVRVEKADAPEFGAAALRVVPLMRFSPARHDGRAVPVRVTLPVAFFLH